MNMQVISLLLLIALTTTDLISASNRPGSGGGCDGAGPTLGLGSGGPPGGGPPGLGGGGPPGLGGGGGRPGIDGGVPPAGGGNATRFLREVAKPATKRYLQTQTIDGRPFTDEDIDRCCSGNGDFEFLMFDLDVSGQSIATEADGFKDIPGDSRWSCRAGCRDEANGFLDDIETCYEACDCRQDCPITIDYLTTECKATCAQFELGSLDSDLCLEKCDRECGERCRSTLNGYIVPLDIYAQGLDILDCYHGDLKGDSAASCAGGQQFWQSEGYTCTVTEGNDFDCECDVPGTCLNMVYPCDFEYYCVSQSPSFVPSDQPSTVPSYVPSTSPSDAPSLEPSASPSESPSAYPTPQPTPRPTRGKGKSSSRSRRLEDSDDDDDDDIRGARRVRRGRTRDRRRVN